MTNLILFCTLSFETICMLFKSKKCYILNLMNTMSKKNMQFFSSCTTNNFFPIFFFIRAFNLLRCIKYSISKTMGGSCIRQRSFFINLRRNISKKSFNYLLLCLEDRFQINLQRNFQLIHRVYIFMPFKSFKLYILK